MIDSLSYLHGHLDPSHVEASKGVTDGLHECPPLCWAAEAWWLDWCRSVTAGARARAGAWDGDWALPGAGLSALHTHSKAAQQSSSEAEMGPPLLLTIMTQLNKKTQPFSLRVQSRWQSFKLKSIGFLAYKKQSLSYLYAFKSCWGSSVTLF